MEPRVPGCGRELVSERRGTLVPDVVGRQRSPFFSRPPVSGPRLVLPAATRPPYRRKLSTRASTGVEIVAAVVHVSAGRSCHTPGKRTRPAAAGRSAQRSTGFLVRQGVAGVFPRLRSSVARCIDRRPYTWRFPPPTRSPTSGRARPPRGGSSLKRTYQPNTRKRAKTHGFRLRMRTKGGRAVLRAASRPRSQASLGLIWRVRDRATFEALAGARRHRAGPVSLRHLSDGSDDPPRVAYAIGRRFGNAVERNRARRRLRAAVALESGELLPRWCLSVRGGPGRHDAPLSHAPRARDHPSARSPARSPDDRQLRELTAPEPARPHS